MMRTELAYFQTRDGARLRYGYWKPSHTENAVHSSQTVVIFQGRASFIEKFDHIITGLLARGFHVWAFDWRGQGLSTRMLKERLKGYIDSYQTYLADIHELLHEKILPQQSGALIVLGQSMGGHLALRYMVEHPHIFDMAILTAPLFDLNTGGYSVSVARALSRLACRLGFGESFVIGHGAYDPRKEPFEGNMLTHNRAAFFHHRLLQKQNPDLSVGGVTYQWVEATFDSIDALMKPEKIGRVHVPVMIISAGQEAIVNNARIEQVVSWLPKGIHKVYPGARHQILSEIPEIIEVFWQDFDNFVNQHLYPSQPAGYLTERRLVKTTQLSGMH
jgi:lysophospholipase